MKENKKCSLKASKIFFVAILFIATSYLISSLISQYKLKKLTTNLQVDLEEQQVKLQKFLQNIDSGQGSQMARLAIKDCSRSERDKFESLLGSLDDKLSASELVELDRLFGRCGNFLSSRDLITSADFSRETELYERLLDNLNTVYNFKGKNDTYNIDTWKQLAQLEMDRSKLGQDLTSQQDTIIRLLLNGEERNSSQIKTVLKEVDRIKSEILIIKNKIRILRTQLSES